MQPDVETDEMELHENKAETGQDKIPIPRNRAPINKGYSVLTRKDGKEWLRIRNKDGQYSEIFPKGTSKTLIRDIAIKKLQELKNSAHGLPTKEFQKITFAMLANAALKSQGTVKFSPNDKININAFLKNEKELCALKLDKITWRDIQRHVNQRLESGTIKPYTITRNLVPIRRIYANALRTDLYGLIPKFAGQITDPFNDKNLKLPADTSGREFPLPYGKDITLYGAINSHCRTHSMKRRMIALVGLAITTALRRGVLLQLRWKDIVFEEKVIKIPSHYYTKKKPAPDMVPISKQLHDRLQDFYNALPEQERRPGCKLFPNVHDRDAMHGRTVKGSPSTRWCDDAWHRIIRLTDLWQPVLDDKKEPMLGDDGTPIKNWFHFHDLRHTAVTRYRNKPYKMGAEYYDYLLGREKHRYAHLNLDEFCDELRDAIDKGDLAVEEQLKKSITFVKTDWGGAAYVGHFRPDEIAVNVADALIKDNEENQSK